MNKIPDHILRIFGGPIPPDPVKKIDPMLIAVGVSILVIAVLIVYKKSVEDNMDKLDAT